MYMIFASFFFLKLNKYCIFNFFPLKESPLESLLSQKNLYYFWFPYKLYVD